MATTALEHTEPDYVRVAGARHEVWIANVNHGRLDVLSMSAEGGAPVQLAFVEVPSGPEGIALDETRARAYTHGSGGSIVVVDMDARAVVDTWTTSCNGTHGIPVVDGTRPFLYAGCGDGSVVVLDVDNGGAEVGSFQLGSGSSIIAYSSALRHLYLRGDGQPTAVALAVSSSGALSELARYAIPARGHCMATTDDGDLWVCDRDRGALVRVHDAAPATAP